MMDPILELARRHLAIAENVPGLAENRPSQAWKDVLAKNHRPVIQGAAQPRDVIERLTSERGFFSLPCLHDEPEFAQVLADGLAWHKASGHDLAALDPRICETELASEKIKVRSEQRAISTTFLWFLRCALRVATHAAPRSVLEIGSGFGGLARVMSLVQPGVRYILVDMPECLWFAEVYLRATLPDATLHYLAPSERLADAPADAQFVLVPVNQIESCNGADVDCVINTMSLSEMTAAAATYYLDWVQRRLEPRFFYNVNRYGNHEDGLYTAYRIDGYCGEDICPNVFGYDGHWDVVVWTLDHAEQSVAAADPRYPRSLELLVRRISAAERSPERDREVAEACEAEARRRLRIDSTFHRLMWTATSKHPTPVNLKLYADILRAMRWKEANYYAERYERLAVEKLPRTPVGAPPWDSLIFLR